MKPPKDMSKKIRFSKGVNNSLGPYIGSVSNPKCDILDLKDSSSLEFEQGKFGDISRSIRRTTLMFLEIN